MNQHLKISIIILLFNAEKYISKCILSLIHQDIAFDEYEIIIINDGSTDKSTQICNKLSETYHNIKHIKTSNNGVSAARNRGIEIAQGELILLSDADDYFTTNTLSDIYETFKEQQLDILIFNYNYWDSQGNLLKGFDYKERKHYPQTIVSGKAFIKAEYIPSTIWTMAYRREYMQKMKFQFTNIRHEDVEFIPRVCYYAEKVIYSSSIVCYNYVQSDTSFMQNYQETGFFDKIKAMDSLNKFKEEFVRENNIRFHLENYISSVLMENLKFSFAINSKVQHQMIKSMKGVNLTPLKHAKRKGMHSFLYNYCLTCSLPTIDVNTLNEAAPKPTENTQISSLPKSDYR